jgi:hypothetical protein
MPLAGFQLLSTAPCVLVPVLPSSLRGLLYMSHMAVGEYHLSHTQCACVCKGEMLTEMEKPHLNYTRMMYSLSFFC